jgi:hypothetical protein
LDGVVKLLLEFARGYEECRCCVVQVTYVYISSDIDTNEMLEMSHQYPYSFGRPAAGTSPPTGSALASSSSSSISSSRSPIFSK